ncbi:MAG: ARC6/PARC6 family protein [Scytonema sp. PMC 1070.18]|nr:ARC6/PARC6 family protein [Scytonema sp. PMC 1070.18]
MKKIFLYLLVYLVYGCNSDIKADSNSNFVACPEKPTTTLKENDVQEIVLSEQTLTKSSQASASKSIGYRFAAQSGQRLSFSTESDICIWVYSPDNQILNDLNLPQNGKYLIQIAALKGSKTFDISMTLGILKTDLPPTPTISNTSITTSPSPSPSSSTPSSTVDLTEEKALEIINEWLAAKPQIFAPPFDTSLVEKLTTGTLYQKTTNPDPNQGPVAWLRSTNSYYKYNKSEIQQVIEFSKTGRQPYMKIKVFEELYLYSAKGNIDWDNSGSFNRNFIYFFEKDSNGIWKIYDYQKVS